MSSIASSSSRSSSSSYAAVLSGISSGSMDSTLKRLVIAIGCLYIVCVECTLRSTYLSH